jgi:hypothetical protein
VELREVYIVQHSYELDGCDETKFIGVYRTREAAEATITRLLKQPGFWDHPDAFSIDLYALDEDNWTEGFATEPA